MNKDLVVEIFVPIANSDGKQGKLATGYPVAKDLILTARHALHPKNRDEDYPIGIRWQHPECDCAKWWPVELVAWDGGETFDVALLKSIFPKEIEGHGFLSGEKPHDNMSWVSEGFAQVGGKIEGVDSSIPMSGKVFSAPGTKKTFQLHNEAPPEEQTDWQGASGSPVFVNQRIIGVVVTCPDNFNAARLQATPAWKLLQDEQFRKEIGFDDMGKRRKQFHNKLTKELSQSRSAVQTLAQEMDYRMTAYPEEQRPTYLADRLLDLDIMEAIKVCKDAYKSLLEEDKSRDAQAIGRVIQVILPAIYDFSVVEGVRSRRSDISAALVALPAGIRTVAEIIMAGVDRRQTEYRSNVGDERFPEGRYSLPIMPEMGIDPEGDKLKKAMDTHFIEWLRPESANAWHDYMIKGFVGNKEPGRQRTPEQLIKLASDELTYLAEVESKTYYFIVPMLTKTSEVDQTQRETFMSLIRELKAQYPAVVFLSLSYDFELERAERRRYRPLSDMLPKEEGN